MKFRNLFLIALIAVSAYNTGCAQKKGKKDSNNTETTKLNEMDSISYAFGVVLGNNLKQSNVEDLDIEVLKKGIQDVINGKASMDAQQAGMAVSQHMQAKAAVIGETNRKAGEVFLAQNKTKEGVVELESGLQYKIITKGTGAIPKAADQVTTHYHGTLIDGTVFDSSVERGEPATFPVGGVIKGWQEILQLMPTGSKWQIYVPADLAYGERDSGPTIGPNSTLIFDIELIEIK